MSLLFCAYHSFIPMLDCFIGLYEHVLFFETRQQQPNRTRNCCSCSCCEHYTYPLDVIVLGSLEQCYWKQSSSEEKEKWVECNDDSVVVDCYWMTDILQETRQTMTTRLVRFDFVVVVVVVLVVNFHFRSKLPQDDEAFADCTYHVPWWERMTYKRALWHAWRSY